MGIALQISRGFIPSLAELVQVDDIYSIRDRHHRISASCAVGKTYIDVQVNVMKLHYLQLYRCQETVLITRWGKGTI